jgi:CRAL/TRIO domain
LINAPWGFATVWNIVKHLLDAGTVEKIAILSSSYQTTLLQQIHAVDLPTQLGGKCQCPGGCELSDAGPWRDSGWMEIEENADAKVEERVDNPASTDSSDQDTTS